jgi:hypothetical protein
VQRLEVDTGRIVATFKRTVVPPCPSALFITTLLEEGVTAANATAAISSSDSESSVGAAARALPDFTKYPIGCTRDATVIKVYCTYYFASAHCLHMMCMH